MSFISLGTIDKKIIPIIIGCIFAFLTRLLFNYDGTTLFRHSIISNVISSFPRIFAFIPLIIFKIRTKKVKNVENDIVTQGTFGRYATKNATKGKWIFIVLTSVIFFIQGILLVSTVTVKTNSWILDILFTCLFSYWIFKIKIFKHHYISIIIIILTGLIFDLSLGNIQDDFSKDFLNFLLRLIREIIYSLDDVLVKYTMVRKYCSVYEICLYNGLICSALLMLFALIDHYYFSFDNYEEYFKDFHREEVGVIFLFIIAQLGVYLSNLFTNRDNTPLHIFIIYVFGQIGYYVFGFSLKSLILIICLIFILFWALVFNEIIEINCFGLSDNTKRKISFRAETEITNIIENDETDRIELGTKNEGEYIVELRDKTEEQE